MITIKLLKLIIKMIENTYWFDYWMIRQLWEKWGEAEERMDDRILFQK